MSDPLYLLCRLNSWQALQAVVREQALQIGALRIQQAFRGRGHATQLQRLQHVSERL